jgi:hypothetical protein
LCSHLAAQCYGTGNQDRAGESVEPDSKGVWAVFFHILVEFLMSVVTISPIHFFFLSPFLRRTPRNLVNARLVDEKTPCRISYLSTFLCGALLTFEGAAMAWFLKN